MTPSRMIRSTLATGMLALGLMGALQAHASVVIGATRVILNAKDREATVKVANEGYGPALIQTWVDKGDPKAAPSSIEVPLTVTPPVARIEPAKGQTLRVLYTGEPLPENKESLFWLNVLEVPPKPTGELATANTLQLAFRTRIKLFFRPTGLPGNAADAPAAITWRMTQSGKTLALEGHNPTPYHVSLDKLEVLGDSNSGSNDVGGMIGPGETSVFTLKGDVSIGAYSKVRYRAINDWGGPVDGESPMSMAN